VTGGNSRRLASDPAIKTRKKNTGRPLFELRGTIQAT
jgi:hypothetical protein